MKKEKEKQIAPPQQLVPSTVAIIAVGGGGLMKWGWDLASRVCPSWGVLFQTLHLCCKAPWLMLTDLLTSQVCDATASSQFQIKNPFFQPPQTQKQQ